MLDIKITIDRVSSPSPSINLRRVRKWGDPVMVAEGWDVNIVGTSNFQAVKTWNHYTGFGAVSNYLNIPHAEVVKLEAMQIPDNYTRRQKMEWLCSWRGSIYMYDDETDDWQTAPTIRWGTLTLGGNLVQVEGYETVIERGSQWRMARLKGFMPSDWSRPLSELVAEGLVHRAYCAYFPDNGFGDSPKGIVYTPFFSPQGYDFGGATQPTALYIPEIWLE